MENNMLPFNVKEVNLSGKNLVEASAGTGKTYSIAILVLRMIIEKKYNIDQQLIVTFTNFAVAELQERIRSFVKQAYDIALRSEHTDAHKNDDPIIRDLVLQHKADEGLSDRLRLALLSIDESCIITIHGFCQQMLREFAFETKQNFQAELQNDVSDLIDQVCNQFWRKELSNLPIRLFDTQKLLDIKNTLSKIFEKALANQILEIPEECKSEKSFSDWEKEVLALQENRTQTEKQLIQFVADNKAELELDVKKSSYAVKKYGATIENPETFFRTAYEVYLNNEVKGYYSKFTSDFWKQIEALVEGVHKINNFQFNIEQYLYYIGLRDYFSVLEDIIEKANVLTFNAMIHNLHQAVVIENNETLIRLIRAKFPVAFIDEFQDTDAVQFELFQKLFVDDDDDNDSILFLIGDPKQSIYAFRSADVDSYLHASKKVTHRYTMNTNFRSSENMVNAVNYFFEASGDAAFGYQASDDLKITYQNVAAQHKSKQMLQHGIPVSENLIFAPSEKVDEALDYLCKTIAHLLNPKNGFSLDDGKGNVSAVLPQDIAILSGSKSKGLELKMQLHNLNIPAVSIDDNTILHSQEAKDISLILQAMVHPNINNIKAAIYLTFLHKIYNAQTQQLLPVLQLDELELVELFTSYRLLINEEKVYQALQKLFGDFGVQQILSKQINTQRSLSNIVQLAELLHQQQYRQALSAEELWLWLKKAISSDVVLGDEYTLQIESDEKAVNILTIHKSKGLEFPIVFVYGIHQKPMPQIGTLTEVKDAEGKRKLILKENVSEEEINLIKLKADQEKRRLIYVALTRSVYQCYVFYSTNRLSETVLLSLLTPLSTTQGVLLDYQVPTTEHANNYTRTAIKQLKGIIFSEKDAARSKSNWSLLSYSSLSIKHDYELMEYSNSLKDYDQFVFNVLPKGANAGTKLHEIFEKIDFAKDYTNTAMLNTFDEGILKKFNKSNTDYSFQIATHIQHVTQAKIEIDDASFQLKNIPYTNRLNELEFNFTIAQDDVYKTLLPLLARYNTSIQDKYFNLNGMMTGFVDLLFEHEGKYYILDWKSNYLGFELSDYEGENLAYAMHQNQYTLQYLIYTLAVHKFLKQRLGNAYDYNKHFGGVIYIFLRGARKNKNSGIFTDRPSLDFIEQLEKVL